MTDAWQSLVDVLDEMLAVYRSLLELGEKKRSLLVQAKPDEIEEITRREEALVIKGNELENRRAKATAVIVTTVRLANAAPTLAELAAAAEPDAAERLRAASRDLGSTVRELTRVNTINAKLNAQALAFVNYNMNLLTRSQAENTYAPAGTAPVQRLKPTLLDRKV